MSAVYGVNATKIAAMKPSNTLLPGESAGKVRVFSDEYEAAALASGSTITVGPELPVGARIVEVIVSSDNLGNNTTLAVGDADDADRYITATNHGGAAATTRLNAVDGLNYEIDGDDDQQVIITTGTGAGTGTIQIVVMYVLE